MLNSFERKLLRRPDWSSIIMATVDKGIIQDLEKMSNLKTLLSGKAKSATSGIGYSGPLYSAAWSILETKFGRPHLIIDVQLESLRKANKVKPHDSASLIQFSVLSQTL